MNRSADILSAGGLSPPSSYDGVALEISSRFSGDSTPQITRRIAKLKHPSDKDLNDRD